MARLAAWMRARGKERGEAIRFRDAEAAEAIDAVLFVGLANSYPPAYECGARGYATCADVMQATKELRRESKEVEFVVLLGVIAAWLTSEQARGRLLRLRGQRRWYRWVLGGGAVIAVEFLGITLVRHDFGLTWLAVLGFFVLAVSAVVTGIAMGVRDLRQCRSRAKPA